MINEQEKQLQTALDRVRRRGIEAVLFDMDGVLVDSIAAHMQAWNSSLEQGHLTPLDLRTYLDYVGNSNREILTRHLDRLKLDVPAAARTELIARKENLLRTIMRNGVTTTPGVTDWLEYLEKKGIRCAVASSGEMANIVTVLESLRLANYFTSLVSGSSLPATKPDPLIFLLAAASLGVSPERCLVVEDAPAGIQAARAAGMASCAVSTTVPAYELREADILLDNLAQLAPDSLFADGSTNPRDDP
jgi:beta-phosphoglucomutase family hydrolase